MKAMHHILAGALALFVLLPACLTAQDDEARFESNRQRWAQMTPEERAVMRQRFEKMRQLSPEEREALHERARNLRHLENGLRKAPPAELKERLRGKGREREREREVRRYLCDNSERFGRHVREKLPPEVREKLDKEKRPEARVRILREYFHKGRRHGGPKIEHVIHKLDITPEEKERILALPPKEQEALVLQRMRAWIEAKVKEHGLPPGIPAEDWEKMRSLSDHEFFTRMRGAERMPEHLRGRSFFGRGRGMRGRGGELRDKEAGRPEGRRGRRGSEGDSQRRGDRRQRGTAESPGSLESPPRWRPNPQSPPPSAEKSPPSRRPKPSPRRNGA